MKSECTNIKLKDYTFNFVQELMPAQDNNGEILQLQPHLRYNKQHSVKLHKYGLGPFCEFRISGKWAYHQGVYALLEKDTILYVGQCKDFAQRFNMGYGTISPRNCYQGGQSTNCKINSMILQKYLQRIRINLYFYETNMYNEIERELIEYFHPPFNGQMGGHFKATKTVFPNTVYPKENRPSTIRNSDKVLDFLSNNLNAYCDDCLSQLCAVFPRQQIYQICSYRLVNQINSEVNICHHCGKQKKTRTIAV